MSRHKKGPRRARVSLPFQVVFQITAGIEEITKRTRCGEFLPLLFRAEGPQRLELGDHDLSRAERGGQSLELGGEGIHFSMCDGTEGPPPRAYSVAHRVTLCALPCSGFTNAFCLEGTACWIQSFPAA
jgi:hypothetical protein